jgi:hypothetical protein
MRSDELRRQRLASQLESLRRVCFEPLLEAGDGSPADPKMGGTPLGDPPVCKGCKQTMVLLLQLDPRLLPEGAPLAGKVPVQIFHCGRNDCDYGDVTFAPGGTGVVLRAAKESKKPRGAVAKGQASRIVGWKATSDLPGGGDVDGLELDAKQLRLMRSERSREGDKLGGYPSWIQSPNTPSCPTCDQPMRFVFQLTARLVDFGDSGLGYVHQCAKHPAKLAFSWSST